MTSRGHLTRSVHTAVLHRLRTIPGIDPDEVYQALSRVETATRSMPRHRAMPAAVHVALVLRGEAGRAHDPRVRSLLLTVAADQALGRVGPQVCGSR